MRKTRLVRGLGLLLGMLLALPVLASPLTTAITYQGRLDRSGSAVSDTYNFIFRLYDATTAGAQVGTDQTVNGVSAPNGLFNVTLDFGAAAFTGQARWLEIQVKGTGDAGFTTLTPRQPLTATPYALYALNGSGGSSQWTSDGLTNITSGGGMVGATGQWTGAPTSGKGVWLAGSQNNACFVFGYDYGTGTAVPLYINNSGGNVAIGAVSGPPAARLDVLTNGGLGVQSITKGSVFNPVNAALRGVGNTGTGPSAASAMGVYGTSTDDRGVWGVSSNNWGTSGDCLAAGTYGILGTPNEGVFGYSPNVSKPAGRFNAVTNGVAIEANGLVKVKTLQIMGGADLAERFESSDHAEPGTVMAIDPASPGRVRVADAAYSHAVAGVVSGANHLNAGVELGTSGAHGTTVALALTGRVWVKCDATRAPIHAGDLLTTSARAGHAMAATDRERSGGAILGKAMTALDSGTGMVLVLVSLQ